MSAFPRFFSQRASLLPPPSFPPASHSVHCLKQLIVLFLSLSYPIHYSTRVMKFFYALFVSLSVILSSLSTTRALPKRLVNRGVDPGLIPQFGVTPGVNPTGPGGSCQGVLGPNGQPILIPCHCPPDRGLFIAVIATHPISMLLYNMC